MATFARFGLTSTGFPQFTLSTTGFAQFAKAVADEDIIPQYVEGPVTVSPTPFNTPNGPVTVSPTTFPPVLHIPEYKSDYDYEELDIITIMKDRLEELKIGWPLNETDEEVISNFSKHKNPNASVSDRLIREAYVQGNPEQKKTMLELADKLNYQL